MKSYFTIIVSSLIAVTLASCAQTSGNGISPKKAAAKIDAAIDDNEAYVAMKEYLPDSAAAYRATLVDIYTTAKSQREVKLRVFVASRKVRRDNAKYIKLAPDEDLIANLRNAKSHLDAFGDNTFACNEFLSTVPDELIGVAPNNRLTKFAPEMRALGMGKHYPVQRPPLRKTDLQAFRTFFLENGGTQEHLELVDSKNSLSPAYCDAMRRLLAAAAQSDAQGADRVRAHISFIIASTW